MTCVLVLTSTARHEVDNSIFSIILILIGALMCVAVTAFFSRLAPLLSRLANGPPAFESLGHEAKYIPKHLLRTSIRTSHELSIEFFTEDDAHAMAVQAECNRDVDEAILHAAFTRLALAASETPDPHAIETDWKNVWEDELLTYRVGEATLHDTYSPPSYSSALIPLRIVGVARLVGGMLLVFQTILLFLAFQALTGGGSWLTVVQVGLVTSFLISMIIYLNHIQAFGQITLAGISENELPDEIADLIPKEVSDRTNSFAGTVIIPRYVKFTTAYFSAIRNFFARNMLVNMTYNALFMLALMVPSVVGTVIFAANRRDDAVVLYGKLALVVVLIPVSVVLTFFLASLLIQHLRYLAAAAIGGLVTAILPIALQYISTGSISGNKGTIISAVVAGLVGTFASAAGALLTKRIGAAPATAT